MSYILQCQKDCESISVGTTLYLVNNQGFTIVVPDDAGVSILNVGNTGASLLSVIDDGNTEQAK